MGDNSHYGSFVDAVDKGIFDLNPVLGDYFRDIRERAKYIQSPIKADSTFEAFGLSKEDFGNYRGTYVKKALAKKKAIPLEELVCVEDDFSAVFVENDPEKEITLKVTVYKDLKESEFPIDGTVYYGRLKWYGVAMEKNYFEVFDFYAGFVFDGLVIDIPEDAIGNASIDLANAVTTAIEQLAYMEREGMLGGVRRL